MKTSSNYWNLIIFALLPTLAFNQSSFSQTNNFKELIATEEIQKIKPPKNPLELWNRLAILLDNKYGGFVTKQEVENVLGIIFTQSIKDDEKHSLGADYFYKFESGVNDLNKLAIALFEEKARSDLVISWNAPCLSFETIKEKLNSLGWDGELWPKKYTPPPPAPNKKILGIYAQYQTASFYLKSDLEKKDLDKSTEGELRKGTSNILIGFNQFNNCAKSIKANIWLK